MTELPNKLYFKIGEVARLAGVEPHVLRYWETEFREITPAKSRSRQRLYRRQDVERILKIKSLLYQEGYTIDGARRRLRELGKNGRPTPISSQLPIGSLERERRERRLLHDVKRELDEVLSLLQQPGT